MEVRTDAPDERRGEAGFLLEGTRTGKLRVTRRDGSPYVLPVWFLLNGDDVIFNTGAETVRGRALRRDGRASMLVDDERPPYSFVRVDGHTVLSEDLDEMRHWARALGARDMGEEVADLFVADHIAAQADLSA